jgi:quinol monooxygenase YgiN
VARFDVVQQIDDPTRFVLWEVYRSAEDVARHKETTHFFAWRRAIAGLMAEPLSSIQLANVYPDDAGWD